MPSLFTTRRPASRFACSVRMAVALLVTVADAVAVQSTAAAPGGQPPANERIVVRGLTHLDPTQLARALLANDELLLLSSPLTPSKTFLAAVADKATLALQHEGFATAQATASIEHGADGEWVAVDVVEGPREMAAGIEITGLPNDLAQGLRRWLKSQRPPPGAVPQSSDVQDGWSGTHWLDSRGQPARLEMPAWRPGHPAPFDPHQLVTVRHAVGRFLREQGYFAAATLVEKQKPSGTAATRPAGAATFDAVVRSSAAGAVLAITFTHLPPASILRGIELFPGSRTNSADLQKLLGITPGSPVTERDRLAWCETLRLSGRFVRHEVKLQEVRAADGGVPELVAVFDLSAYPHVAPLAEPLSREEQVLLAFRKWLLQTLADDNDLVLTWTLAPGGEPPPATRQPVGSLVVSTHEGLLLTALPGSPDACGVAVSGDGFGWFLPGAAGRFEVPLPVRQRAAVNVSLFLTEVVEVGQHKYPRRFNVSYGVEPRPHDAAAALAATAQIEPVACIAFLHEGNPTVGWEGDELVVERSDKTARFDSRTGRLLSLHFPAGGSIAIDAAPGRFRADLAALRLAAGDNRARNEALVSSGIEFLTSAAMGAAVRHLLEAVGMQQRLAVWQERVDAVADTLRMTAESGGFAATDRVVAAALSRAADDASAVPLTIPSAEQRSPAPDPAMALAQLAAAQAWRWTEQACGQDAWPAALARVATLAAKGDAAVLWELSAFMTTKRNGPLAYLAAASVAPLPSLAITLARQGQQRLTVEAFHDDCRPLLAVLRSCGVDRCAVALLRRVDDDEARLLGEKLLQDPGMFLPLVHDLRSRDSDDDAVATLSDALDHWWGESLHTLVTAALTSRVQLQTADKPAADDHPRR